MWMYGKISYLGINVSMCVDSISGGRGSSGEHFNPCSVIIILNSSSVVGAKVDSNLIPGFTLLLFSFLTCVGNLARIFSIFWLKNCKKELASSSSVLASGSTDDFFAIGQIVDHLVQRP